MEIWEWGGSMPNSAELYHKIQNKHFKNSENFLKIKERENEMEEGREKEKEEERREGGRDKNKDPILWVK